MEEYMAHSETLRFLRKKMKVIFWFTAVVFIGLVIFGWGAGLTGRERRGKLDANLAGKVENHEISYLDYQNALQFEYEQAYGEGRSITESEAEILRDRVFYTLINRYLANDEMKNKKIDKITNLLIYESVKRNPPEAITQNPSFRTEDGMFNRPLFEEYLRNPQIDWLPIENMVRGNLPYQRLQQLVGTFPVTTNIEAQIEYVFRYEQAKASYIKYDPFALENIAADTSDRAVDAYYQANKEKYRSEGAGIINYAMIPLMPTQADSQEAHALAETLMAKLAEGEDFQFLAENFSDDGGSKARGGVLGWFGKGQMVEPFEQAAFAADSGAVVGPVLTDFGYHIINVLGKEGNGDSTRVLAAHILLTIEPGQDTESAAKDLANSLIFQVEGGENFFEVCEALEIDSIGRSGLIKDEDPIPMIGFNERIRTMIKTAKPGTIDQVIVKLRERPILQGITVVQLHKRFSEGVPELIDIRDQVVADILMDARKAAVVERGRNAQQLILTGTPMTEAAKQTGGVFDTTGFVTRYDWIEGVGMSPKFAGTLFGLPEKGLVSRPIMTDDGSVFIIRLDEKLELNPEEFNRMAAQIKSEIAQFNRENAYEKWFSNLRKNSEIIDNRFADHYTDIVDEKETE